MRTSGRRLVAIGAAGLLAVTALASTALGAGTTRPTYVVDDDGSATARGCSYSGDAYTSIQEAIDEAPDGAQILVCPGTYTEEVVIEGRSTLLIKATKSFEATILGPNGGPSFSPAIVTIAGSYDIVMSGFRVVHENDDKCGNREVGAWIFASRGVQFRGNRVLSDGPDSLSGCFLAIGILVGLPDVYGTTSIGPSGSWPFPDYDDWATTATIYANTVQDYALAGIVAVSTALQDKGLVALGRTDAIIQSNSIRYMHSTEDASVCDEAWDRFMGPGSAPAGSGKVARFTRRLSRVLSPAGTGPGICPAVGIYSGAGTIDTPIAGAAGLIKSNQLMSSVTSLAPGVAGPGPGDPPIPLVGIAVVDQLHSPGAVTLYGNRVVGHFLGIGAADARGLSVKSNTLHNGYIGILVADTDTASVLSNKAQYNYVGIVATNDGPEGLPFAIGGGSAGVAGAASPTPNPAYVTQNVTFKSNYANYNYQASCIDDTTGTRTRGTANTWSSNRAEAMSSQPLGICGGATPAPTPTVAP